MPSKKSTYKVLDDYCLRTPLYDLSFFDSIFKSKSIDFRKILKDKVLREAIYLGSPDLYEQIENWENDRLFKEKKVDKLQISVLKYCIRIATRCTPFGLFASCYYGTFNHQSSINIGGYKQKNRVSAFDYTFLTEIKQYILSDIDIRKNLRFFPNSSLYKIGNDYRYIEYKIHKGKRTYTLEGIKKSDYLEKIINYSKKGKSLIQLTELLSNDDIANEDVENYINELIDSQILVSELEITITGSDFLNVLLSKLKNIPNASEISKNLKNLEETLKRIDKGFGNDIVVYKDIYKRIKNYVPSINEKYLIQTDLLGKPILNSLNSNIQKKLKNVFMFFNKITLSAVNPRIVAFKKRFIERYGDEEIPLNFALDFETGLGYGNKNVINSSILSNLYNINSNKKRYERVIWTDFDTIISEKLENAYKNGKYIINLSRKDIKDLPQNNNDLPDTLAGIAELYKSENENTIFIKNFSGSSSNNLLGRFGNDNKEIKNIISKVTAIENNLQKEDVLAEIVHLPESRTGNILKRTNNRNYEIPYLAKSNLPMENQIPLNDIYISIKNDEIKLKSKKLDKYIQPRLGNAHNFSNTRLPIYLFLCELQSQNKRPGIGFGWNNIFLKNKFLPRVVFEDVIVSKARWKINTKDFMKITSNSNKKFLKHWKIENKIPDLVEMVEGDNKLSFDLTSQISLKVLVDACKTKEYFILEEFLFSSDELVKDNEGKSYSNQFIFSFYKEEVDA